MTKPPALRMALRPRGTDPGVCLGFQWDASTWEELPRLWDTLAGWLGDRPAFWNLPSFPPGMAARRRVSVARPVADRVEVRHEPVSAAGFSGACHPLLNIDELDREVSWGLRNPWQTGLTDVLGMRPRILVPRVPDLQRADAWKVYRDHGFAQVGACVRQGCRLPAADRLLVLLRVHVCSWSADAARSRRRRRSVPWTPGLVLLLDLGGCTDAAALKAALEDPSGLFGGRVPTLAPLAEPPGELPPGPVPAAAACLDWAPFSVPDLHAALDETAPASKRKRKKSEELGELLSTLSAPRERPAEPAAVKRPYQPQLLAHMLGDVTLGGSAFDVRLHGGRFCGIVRQGTGLTPLRPAGAWLRMGRGLSSLRTVSSVSFESEAGTGLQEVLGMDGRDGTLVRIEYSFRDDSPDLLIDLDLQLPALPQELLVDEYAPLALALRALRKDEDVRVEVAAPDGSASSVQVPSRGPGVLAAGAEHRVRRADGGWIVLRFSAPSGRSWGLPWFRVARYGRERVLECNPFGSYEPVPARALARRASFRMSLGIA